MSKGNYLIESVDGESFILPESQEDCLPFGIEVRCKNDGSPQHLYCMNKFVLLIDNMYFKKKDDK